jgi:hypothetical protein
MAVPLPLYDPQGYALVRFLFRRGLALVYLLAFLVAATQFRALAGEDGLLPLGNFADRADFRRAPSLFHLVPSDRAVGVAAWGGAALSAAALVGLPARLGTLPAMAVWGAMWALYLSFVNAGRTFYGFGWESMLLETGFLAVFLGGANVAPPAVVIWLLRWVLFRNVLGSGLIKLRGDDCWRELTCMDYHYETQPMPNPLSWYAHHLPKPVHRGAVLVNHVVELAIPFLYFLPQPLAAAGGSATLLFMGWLMLTGNFAFLNALTVVLAVPTFADGLLAEAVPAGVLPTGIVPAVGAPTPAYLGALAWTLAALVLVLSVRPALNLLSARQAMNSAFDPLHLVNTYGAFGSITRDRHELVVQGTREADPGPADWETYTFPGKPTDPERRPPQWAPYHLRLDWQLWFAAMSPPRRNPWFVRLLGKLLAGDERTLSLLRSNPFPEAPPEQVRAVRYRYRFTTPEERRETGQWWARERVGLYYGPVSASDPRIQSLVE